MNTYAQIAINVVNQALKANIDPVDSWDKYSNLAFGTGTAAASKSCPKTTFLGLCEEGYIKGINPGHYTRSILNKEYGLRAVDFIKEDNKLVDKPEELWQKITNGYKKHNGQMAVVCELYKHGMIVD